LIIEEDERSYEFAPSFFDMEGEITIPEEFIRFVNLQKLSLNCNKKQVPSFSTES
jgi:hypothetical protein